MRNYLNGIFVIFLFIFIISLSFSMTIYSMDYIWNYGFSAKIGLGLIPYRDFSLLQTPLYFYINAIFLKALGNYIVIQQCIGILIILLMYYLLYLALSKLNEDRRVTFGILLLTVTYTIGNCMMISYNTLAIALVLAIVLCEFNNRLDIKNNIFIGVFLGLLFLTKQNISAFVVFFSVINILFCRADFCSKVKILFIRGTVSIAIASAYIGYLYVNDALYPFIDHAVLGVADFARENRGMISFYLLAYLLAPTLLIILSILKLIKENRFSIDDRFYIVVCYSIASLSMSYPMLDFVHISIGILPALLLLPFIIKPGFFSHSATYSLGFLLLTITGLLLLAISGLGSVYYSTNSEENTGFYHPNKFYHLIWVDDKFKAQLAETSQYIQEQEQQGKNVVIVDSNGMAYRLEMGEYRDPFDLLIRGNVGYNGTEKILNKFKMMDDNTLFLIGKVERNFDMPRLKEYVLCHSDAYGELSKFMVYKKRAMMDNSLECAKLFAEKQ